MIHINKQTILAAATLIGMTVSCKNEKAESFCPTWKGFTYSITRDGVDVPVTGRIPTFVPGDWIHLTACQATRGNLINGTDYSWTLCYDKEIGEGKTEHVRETVYKHTNYDGYADGANDPRIDIQLPADAKETSQKPDTIIFVARYAYSATGATIENGNIVDNSYSGRITPQSGPTGGGAAGYFYFHVTK